MRRVLTRAVQIKEVAGCAAAVCADPRSLFPAHCNIHFGQVVVLNDQTSALGSNEGHGFRVPKHFLGNSALKHQPLSLSCRILKNIFLKRLEESGAQPCDSACRAKYKFGGDSQKAEWKNIPVRRARVQPCQKYVCKKAASAAEVCF